MSVNIITGENAITAYISGEVDHHSAKETREEIDASIARIHPDILILDFKDVTFMDSSGIGLVMGRYKVMKSIGGEIRIANTSSHIKKVMRLAGLDRLAVIEK